MDNQIDDCVCDDVEKAVEIVKVAIGKERPATGICALQCVIVEAIVCGAIDAAAANHMAACTANFILERVAAETRRGMN